MATIQKPDERWSAWQGAGASRQRGRGRPRLVGSGHRARFMDAEDQEAALRVAHAYVLAASRGDFEWTRGHATKTQAQPALTPPHPTDPGKRTHPPNESVSSGLDPTFPGGSYCRLEAIPRFEPPQDLLNV